MDRLTALNVFRHAADLGSFAAAARQLGLSPAAVSKNIGELEAHLGARLFNRTTRRMSLTDAGARYYERIRRVLEELEEADNSLGAMQTTPSGLLRVSAPVTLTLMTSLSAALPRFLERHPALSLELRMDDRRSNLIEEGFDLAIRASDSLEDSSLIARKLMPMPHVVCAAPDYLARHGTPKSPEDLRRHNCIQFTLSGHAASWEFQKGGRKFQIPVDGRYKVTSSFAVRDALRAGFGLSLIPRIYVQDDIAAGRLKPLLEAWATTETSVYAVYPSRRHLSAKLRAFLDFLAVELSSGESRPREGAL